MKLHEHHGVLIHSEFDLLLNCLGYRGRETHLTERRAERNYLHDADAIIHFFFTVMWKKILFRLKNKDLLLLYKSLFPWCHVQPDSQSWIFVSPTSLNLNAHKSVTSADIFFILEW